MRAWWMWVWLIFISSLRARVSLFFSFAFPLMFMLVFGYLAGRDPRRLRFVAAQMFTMIVVANTLFALTQLMLQVRQKGVLRRLHTTPMSRHQVLSGIVAAWLLISSLTFVWMLMAFESLFHAKLLPKLLGLWGLYLLGALAFAGIALMIANLVDTPEGAAMAANVLFFPMLFFCGLSIPSFLLPEPIQQIGKLLPAYALFEFFQGATWGKYLGGMTLVHTVSLLLMGVGGYAAALAVYRWDPEQRLRRAQYLQLMGALILLLLIPWAGTAVGQSAQQIRAWLAPRYILKAKHLFDGERVFAASPVYIGIQGDRIAFVSATIPQGWQRVRVHDWSNGWVMPGLIEMHAHLESPVVFVFDPSSDPEDRLRHDLRTGYLGSGVMAVRSFGDDSALLRRIRRIAEATAAPYPHLMIAGPIFTAPGGHPLELPAYRWMSEKDQAKRVRQVATPADARTALQALLKEFRLDWIKAIYDSGIPEVYGRLPCLSRETLAALIEEAHRHGLPVAVHISKVSELREAVQAGADMIEHTPLDAPIDEPTLKAMKQRGVAVCPTVFVGEARLQAFAEQNRTDEFLLQRLMPPLREQLRSGNTGFHWLEMMPGAYRDMARRTLMTQTERLIRMVYTNVQRMAQAGIPLVAGSDAGNPDVFHGVGLLNELEALVRAGLTPVEALRAGTGTPARLFRLPFGRVAPGQQASLILLRHDPTRDVRNLRTLHAIILRGQYIPITSLIEPQRVRSTTHR